MEKDALFIRSIARSYRVLEAFSTDRPKLTLTELTRATGMSKSTVQRLVYTLEKEGYLLKDINDKSYKLSMKFFQLGSIALKDSQAVDVAKPYLRRLRDQTGESAYLNIIVDRERMCTDFLPSRHEIQFFVFVGQRSPLYAGASAKVLLSFLSDEEIEEFLRTQPIHKITDQTVAEPAEILKEIEEIRRQGYAVSNQERVVGIYSISFPVFDVSGKVAASISMSIPTVRLKEEEIPEYIERVREAASQISHEMGYQQGQLYPKA